MNPFPEALAGCRRCPRLVEHRERVAREKRRSYRQESYWGRPVPGFGDPSARLLLLGLAPGAHGSNRTGRMFTGDASGTFLYPALWRAGLASAPESIDRADGLRLHSLWITAAARCVPPGNKPGRDEVANCRTWLRYDFDALPELRLVLALGRIAHDSYLDLLKAGGHSIVKARFPFGHGALHHPPGGLPLLDSFHVWTRKSTSTVRDLILASWYQVTSELSAWGKVSLEGVMNFRVPPQASRGGREARPGRLFSESIGQRAHSSIAANRQFSLRTRVF